MFDVSIIIPTRNRVPDLTRCLESIAAQRQIDDTALEWIIVDDGDIPQEVLNYYREIAQRLKRAELVYYKKTRPGVWLSRYEALTLAHHDVVLYLDDDAELDDPLYIRKLMNTYLQDESIVGVGGVAKGLHTTPLGRLLGVLTCQMSTSPGKLSPSSLAGSLLYWNETDTMFETEIFHGCNMSFKRESLRDMLPYPWMTSYAVGDDLYMCALASKYGKLVINPQLKILHHESPRSRDRAGKVAMATAVNHYYLLNMRKAGASGYLALMWTLLYLTGKETLKRNMGAALGYIKGIGFVLNPFKNKYREYLTD
ncbi:glycosyl transferase [Paenibacillus yonginensis]|uniref:Glycosyl transferase n=1 Tax=Paenibacillus yonginensis TaxID=1462996 RepID=A0A1B1MYG9_9BACL|nr:glycosyltransferase family A protein [Paenibacillus yonginensis]ANS74232.1 glycosyl transferase [Paenibacillus yonginensis]